MGRSCGLLRVLFRRRFVYRNSQDSSKRLSETSNWCQNLGEVTVPLNLKRALSIPGSAINTSIHFNENDNVTERIIQRVCSPIYVSTASCTWKPNLISPSSEDF
ncbi:unnamed protein product, partial [Hapterophycus canaliculatus]